MKAGLSSIRNLEPLGEILSLQAQRRLTMESMIGELEDGAYTEHPLWVLVIDREKYKQRVERVLQDNNDRLNMKLYVTSIIGILTLWISLDNNLRSNQALIISLSVALGFMAVYAFDPSQSPFTILTTEFETQLENTLKAQDLLEFKKEIEESFNRILKNISKGKLFRQDDPQEPLEEIFQDLVKLNQKMQNHIADSQAN